MDCIFDRIITVSRPVSQTGAGQQPYGGNARASETVIISGIPASIEQRRTGQRNDPNLPLDGSRATWRIYIDEGVVPDSSAIQDRDFITDDLGRRFQVVAGNPDFMGWTIHVERMEA